MKISGEFRYLASEKEQSKKDPTKTNYYVLLMQNTETCRFFCSNSEAFDKAQKLKQLDMVTAYLDYDPRYGNTRLSSVILKPKPR